MTTAKPPQPLWLDASNMALAADLYQITMMAGYVLSGKNQTASFELFARRLPPNRSCLIACGLEQLVHYLQNLRFSPDSLEFLRQQPTLKALPEAFWDYLRSFRFEGDLWAVPEGTPVFPLEPLLRIKGPIAQTQLIESLALSIYNGQTAVASKAARVVEAAGGKPVFEFGMRRSYGPQAGLFAARASYISGFEGTSNMLAGKLMQIPVVGTMAHSWILSYPSEQEAFEEFRKLYPSSIILVDTYDTIEGVRLAITTGAGLQGIRLDSGDLLACSKAARLMLDESGEKQAQIIVSGNLNEYSIGSLEGQAAPINAYAVGTELVVSADAPSVDLVYKLVSVTDSEGTRPVAKTSVNKTTLGGDKQVFRQADGNGKYLKDLIALTTEKPEGMPLLSQVMEKGSLLEDLPSLNEARRLASEARASLGKDYFLQAPKSYKVEISAQLSQLQERIHKTIFA